MAKKIRNEWWIFSTYFAEGFPFSIIRSSSGVFFRDNAYSLTTIGYTSLFGIPWVIKFFWGHLIDLTWTKKKWITGTEILLFFCFLAFATAAVFKPAALIVFLVFLIASFIAATHDISIDGYYLTALQKTDQEKFVGFRVLAYRLAMVTGSGIIISLGTNFNWFWAYLLAALVIFLLFFWHKLILAEIETFREWKNKKEIIFIIAVVSSLFALALFFNADFFSEWKKKLRLPDYINFTNLIFLLLLIFILALIFQKKSSATKASSRFNEALRDYINQPAIMLFIFFIILARCGEYMLSTMLGPFIVDLGIKKYYGLMSGFTGLPLSILGALAGGYLISRKGLKKTAFPFLFLQNITNLIYALLASDLKQFLCQKTANETLLFIGKLNLFKVILVNSFDQFSSGLGTAVLSVILMKLCKQDFKSMHFAIGSGLMAGGGMITGILSGYLAQSYGYASLFSISFLVSLPAMVILFFLPLKD